MKNNKHKLAEVISIVSHEFKTPLSAIKGYIEVLIAEDLGKLTVGQKDYLKDALENTHRMIELVHDLLDVSQIEQGKLELKPKPSNLENIIRKTIKEFLFVVRAKNCSISFKVLDKVPLLNIDPLKVKQVISNFISNAIRYSERKGDIEVFIKKKGNNVIFECKDNGIGIPKVEKKKIFTKFYRSEKAVIHATGGSGLGLFISKAIIRKSKGKIWFISKEDKGSSFYFSLPIKKYEK